MSINPKQIEVLNPKASYELPLYRVTNNGLEKLKNGFVLRFCKGNKANPNAPRQEGVLTESVVVAVQTYLKENNVGPLENEFTTQMIQKLQDVLDLVDARNADREKRNVQGTYQK